MNQLEAEVQFGPRDSMKFPAVAYDSHLNWTRAEVTEDHVFLPADFIICRGDIGNEMYFLREGCAGVFTCHLAA